MNILAASSGSANTAGIFLLSIFLGLALTTWLGYLAGKSRNRGLAGALCGFLLGPLGIVLALFLPAGPQVEPRSRTRTRTSSKPRRRSSTRRRTATAPRGTQARKPVKPLRVPRQ